MPDVETIIDNCVSEYPIQTDVPLEKCQKCLANKSGACQLPNAEYTGE